MTFPRRLTFSSLLVASLLGCNATIIVAQGPGTKPSVHPSASPTGLRASTLPGGGEHTPFTPSPSPEGTPTTGSPSPQTTPPAPAQLKDGAAIVIGPDGAPWVLAQPTGQVMRRDASGLFVAVDGLKGPEMGVRSPSGEIWIADFNGNAVVAFDATGHEKRRIDAGGNAHFVRLAPDGSAWFLANGATLVHVSANGDMLGKVPVDIGAQASDLGFDAQGRLWLTEAAAGRVLVFDATGAQLAAYPLPAQPKNIVFDAAGNAWMGVWAQVPTGGQDLIEVDPQGKVKGPFHLNVTTNPVVDDQGRIWAGLPGDQLGYGNVPAYLGRIGADGTVVGRVALPKASPYAFAVDHGHAWAILDRGGGNNGVTVAEVDTGDGGAPVTPPPSPSPLPSDQASGVDLSGAWAQTTAAALPGPVYEGPSCAGSSGWTFTETGEQLVADYTETYNGGAMRQPLYKHYTGTNKGGQVELKGTVSGGFGMPGEPTQQLSLSLHYDVAIQHLIGTDENGQPVVFARVLPLPSPSPITCVPLP